MILEEPKVYVEEYDTLKIMRNIERAMRTCYRSEGTITQDSYKRLLKMAIDSGHESVMEHEKITVKEMGKKLHLDSGTLTPVLKKLLSMELINKYRDKNDDRVVIVEVTEKGKKMKEEITEVPEQLYCKFGNKFEDIGELKRLLDNLLKTF